MTISAYTLAYSEVCCSTTYGKTGQQLKLLRLRIVTVVGCQVLSTASPRLLPNKALSLQKDDTKLHGHQCLDRNDVVYTASTKSLSRTSRCELIPPLALPYHITATVVPCRLGNGRKPCWQPATAMTQLIRTQSCCYSILLYIL